MIGRMASSNTATTTTAITMIRIVDMETGYPARPRENTIPLGWSREERAPLPRARLVPEPCLQSAGGRPAQTGDRAAGLPDPGGSRPEERRDADQPRQPVRAGGPQLHPRPSRDDPVGAQPEGRRRGRAAPRAQGPPLPRHRGPGLG